MLDDVAGAIRPVRRLPAFLRHPATDAARGILADRLANREARFRAFFRDVLVGQPGSPYHGLLAAAGCEPGDLDALVLREGIEGALGPTTMRCRAWTSGGALTASGLRAFREIAIVAGEVTAPWPESRFLDRRFIDAYPGWAPR